MSSHKVTLLKNCGLGQWVVSANEHLHPVLYTLEQIESRTPGELVLLSLTMLHSWTDGLVGLSGRLIAALCV